MCSAVLRLGGMVERPTIDWVLRASEAGNLSSAGDVSGEK
jgi:hypothetical protein